MRGLIYGDILGSVYEWKPVEEQKNIKEPKHFTDDTVLGAAVADALLTCWEQNITDDAGILRLVTEKLREYGNRHPDAGYSRSFRAWLTSSDPKPYGSKTNGAIMRCAAAGWLANSPEHARRLGRLTAMPTHDHPEALDAAALTAEIIYRLRMGEPVDKMYVLLNKHYPIPELKDIRPITEFDFSCKTTLPIAFAAFYETVTTKEIGVYNRVFDIVHKSAENAISLGGDTDTNAAIAAAFAEAWTFSWTFRESDLPWKWDRTVWYIDTVRKWSYQWSNTEQQCTEDIIDVVKRMDEAVAQICPIRMCGEYAYRTDARGEAVIIKYPCTEEGKQIWNQDLQKEMAIPATLDGFPVTAISPFAFDPAGISSKFKSCCKLPDGVQLIGDYAFRKIEKVVLPESVEAIGIRAFAYYNSVGSDLPANLKILGAYAFQEVLLFPKLPDGLEYIGQRAISPNSHCWNPGNKWHGEWADGTCVIPKSLKKIGEWAIYPKGDHVWVFKDSCGEAYSRTVNWNCYYADPEHIESEQKRLLENRQQREKQREEAQKREEERRKREQESYELVEVSISRYAGWREHAEEAGYIIDGLDRVFEKRPKS